MDQFTLPLKLTCKVSGKVVTYTSAEYVRKKLEKYNGSLKAMMEDFVCRDAKRGLKENKPVEQIKAEASDTASFTTENGAEITIGSALTKADFKIGKPTPMTKAEAPRDACFNPGWFLNKKSCGACAFNGVCNYEKKRV
jgi:hypothetical protein